MNKVNTINRLNSVRALVQEMLMSVVDGSRSQEACIRLFGVSSFASMLAAKRGNDQEIAAISGLLHDFYFYRTGVREFPGLNSAEAVRPLLRDMKIFAEEELATILRAIFYREDRGRVHGPYEEIVKDACLLQLYFRDASRVFPQRDADRLRNVFRELTIPIISLKEEEPTHSEARNDRTADRRSILADVAETLAKETIVGVPGDERYRDICQYWPDPGIYKVLQSSWCAAFVYYCCMEAGFLLPIRYPNASYRLAGVGAWLTWAQLPETGFFYEEGKNGFIPQRGDMVIYEKLLSDHSHDHIGVVLACDDQEIYVAEGNRDNENYSSVLHRDRWKCIRGYIRIDNGYEFRFSGEYRPIIQ